jgi:hypothetical protein
MRKITFIHLATWTGEWRGNALKKKFKKPTIALLFQKESSQALK